jgi:hypothetical protein
MVREWNEWNATMLAETKESATYNWSGADVADHFGSAPATGALDDVSVWPDEEPAPVGTK